MLSKEGSAWDVNSTALIVAEYSGDLVLALVLCVLAAHVRLLIPDHQCVFHS